MSTAESDPHSEHPSDSGTVALFARRAKRISQADVFTAADVLLVEGHRPTIDRVRMKLGRGSPNTINDHLDAWWAKLGSRLRDLPGQEFPQLPERVAQSLQQLWIAALEGAHETLQSTLLECEQAIAQREQVLESQTRQLTEREQALTTRAEALEESLTLAREQLILTNQRAEALELTVQEWDRECQRLRSRVEVLDANCADARAKLDAATAAHQTERAQLQERHASAERHWLLEVDRARQQGKEASREHEQQTQELRRRLEVLTSERNEFRENLLDARAELKTVAAVHEQLEERVRAAERAASEHARIASARSIVRRPSKRPRNPKSRRRTRDGSETESSP
jgi:chromosome segregation ATPase